MKNKIKGLVVASFLPFVVFADAITSTIDNVVKWISTVGGGLAVLFIVIAGVMMVTSSESADNVKKAQDIIKWAAVGLIIILLANAIKAIIESLVKLS
ncbi:MAG: TrbC/VirB2 family protein [Candidatus Pacebacteria bacterium]|nr:TrbC/VirB2 family protein [Candidatus Paceibacterota bacterium]